MTVSITVDDFKNYFTREFPYLPVWDSEETYSKNAVVYYSTTKLFYVALLNGVTSTPDTTDDWELVEDDVNNYVSDTDIQKAIDTAYYMFNQELWDNSGTIAYLLLTAHILVLDLRTSAQGLNSSGSFAELSKTVGSVNANYMIPQRFVSDPVLSMYIKTDFGQRYLMMLIPRMTGYMVAVAGETLA